MRGVIMFFLKTCVTLKLISDMHFLLLCINSSSFILLRKLINTSHCRELWIQFPLIYHSFVCTLSGSWTSRRNISCHRMLRVWKHSLELKTSKIRCVWYPKSTLCNNLGSYFSLRKGEVCIYHKRENISRKIVLDMFMVSLKIVTGVNLPTVTWKHRVCFYAWK